MSNHRTVAKWECPQCRNDEWSTKDTRVVYAGDDELKKWSYTLPWSIIETLQHVVYVRRRKICNNCGYRTTSVEILADDLYNVVTDAGPSAMLINEIRKTLDRWEASDAAAKDKRTRHVGSHVRE